jgi:hypothetical protein
MDLKRLPDNHRDPTKSTTAAERQDPTGTAELQDLTGIEGR